MNTALKNGLKGMLICLPFNIGLAYLPDSIWTPIWAVFLGNCMYFAGMYIGNSIATSWD